MIFDSVGRKS